MSKAIVLVNSDTSYLENKLSELNYTTYAIDEFNHRNIQKHDPYLHEQKQQLHRSTDCLEKMR